MKKPQPSGAQIQKAASVVRLMYNTWILKGGVSPSPFDEMREIARSRNVNLTDISDDSPLDKAVDKAFNVACSGGTVEEIVTEHLNGLRTAGLI